MYKDLIEFIASDNIAEDLDKKTLDKIGEQVTENHWKEQRAVQRSSQKKSQKLVFKLGWSKKSIY